jgi:hypothetical protein
MINEIRQRMSLGKDIPDCLVKTMLTVCRDENLDDVDMAILASAFMIGGVETVRKSCILYDDVLLVLTLDRARPSCNGSQHLSRHTPKSSAAPRKS